MSIRFVALALVLALGATACDFIEGQFAETAAEIKQEKGLDITSPAQVAGASLLAGDDELEQLNAAKSVQRILNEQRGDGLSENGDHKAAREAYERALSWTRSDDKRNSAAIKEKIAETWIESSVNDRSPATTRGLENAYGTLGSLAADAQDPRTKARLLTKQAYAANNLAEFDKSCELARQALALDLGDRQAKFMADRNCRG